MGPDETEVAEDLGVQTERSVDLTCTQDEEMGPGPPTAPSRGPPTTLSLGTSTTQDEPSHPRYITGKERSSAFDGRSLHPHPHLADGDQTRSNRP